MLGCLLSLLLASSLVFAGSWLLKLCGLVGLPGNVVSYVVQIRSGASY